MNLQDWFNKFRMRHVLCKKAALIFVMLILLPHGGLTYANILNAGPMLFGGMSSVAVHEIGHLTSGVLMGAEVEDVNVSLFSGYVKFKPNPDNRMNRKVMIASGLLTPSVVTELMIQNEGLYDSSFAQGFIIGTLYSNLKHVFDFYTKIVGKNGWEGNDIDSYERAGGNPHLFSAFLLGYVTLSVARLESHEFSEHVSKSLMSATFRF